MTSKFVSLMGIFYSYTGQKMRDCFVNVCKSLSDAEDELNELDRGSGDGDCGSTLRAGAKGKYELQYMLLLSSFCCVYLNQYTCTACQPQPVISLLYTCT